MMKTCHLVRSAKKVADLYLARNGSRHANFPSFQGVPPAKILMNSPRLSDLQAPESHT